MNLKVLLSVFLIFLSPALSSFAQEEGTVPLVVAEGVGTGTSKEEAMQQAWKDAVKNALGMVMDSTTVKKGDELVESITMLSRGYIEKYEVIDESEKDGSFKVILKAWIRRNLILQGLLLERPSTYSLDGKSLYASALTGERQLDEGVDILDEWISSFKYENYVLASVSDPVFRHKSGELSVRISLVFDRERYYRDFASEMSRILDYVSISKERDIPMRLKVNSSSGEVSVVFDRESMAVYENLLGLDSSSQGIGNIYLVTSNFYFSSYTLPEKVFEALWERIWGGPKLKNRGIFFCDGVFNISFKNSSGVEIATEERSLKIDNVILFPHNDKPISMNGKPGMGQALFMIPEFGNKLNDKSDYRLFPKVDEEIVIKLDPNIMRSVAGVECSLVLKR